MWVKITLDINVNYLLYLQHYLFLLLIGTLHILSILIKEEKLDFSRCIIYFKMKQITHFLAGYKKTNQWIDHEKLHLQNRDRNQSSLCSIYEI